MSFYIIGDFIEISYDIRRDRVLNSLKLCLFLSNSERAGIRTPDNLIKSQVLYHLSYTPIYHCLLAKISKITGWVMGFEPTASRATIWRANQLRYTHHIFLLLIQTTNNKTSLKGFEPPTHGLEGRCSIQLSYRLIKAGDGNRTHVISLEGWSSTIELHPLTVGVTGFEPATS